MHPSTDCNDGPRPLHSYVQVCALGLGVRAAWLLLALVGAACADARAGTLQAANFWPQALLARAIFIFSSWDGQLYLDIAAFGYPSPPLHLRAAFFPLYPAILRALARILPCSPPLCGLLLNNGADLLASCLLFRLCRRRLGRKPAARVLHLWLLYPGRYAGFNVGTEGLYLLLTLAAFSAFEARAVGWALLATALVGATRVPGAFVGLGLAVQAWQAHRRWTAAAFGLAAALGPLVFATHLQAAIGRPWAFLQVQGAWHRGASWPWQSLGRSAEVYDHLAAWAALTCVVWLWRRRHGPLGERLCASASVALPLCTGRLMSMQRFVGVIFVLWMGPLGAVGVAGRRALGLYGVAVSALLAWKLGFGHKVV